MQTSNLSTMSLATRCAPAAALTITVARQAGTAGNPASAIASSFSS
jgi:hypothetical protein